MKKQLKKITDLTINELLNTEVILPSIYFEKFNEKASIIEIDLEDKDFSKEINKLIVDEYKTIEEYMKSITSNIQTIKNSTKDAKNAIVNKDTNKLTNIYKKMNSLEDEISKLTKKLYYDEGANIYNRKWIYNSFLNRDACFQTNGVAILIDILDFDYIKKEYGELLANNLTIFAINFIKKNLLTEKIDFNFARFFENKLLIFVDNEQLDNIKSTILNIQQLLTNTTLKSNSGLMIKANYKFAIESYYEKQDSKELFEKLFYKLKEV